MALNPTRDIVHIFAAALPFVFVELNVQNFCIEVGIDNLKSGYIW